MRQVLSEVQENKHDRLSMTFILVVSNMGRNSLLLLPTKLILEQTSLSSDNLFHAREETIATKSRKMKLG